MVLRFIQYRCDTCKAETGILPEATAVKTIADLGWAWFGSPFTQYMCPECVQREKEKQERESHAQSA